MTLAIDIMMPELRIVMKCNILLIHDIEMKAPVCRLPTGQRALALKVGMSCWQWSL